MSDGLMKALAAIDKDFGTGSVFRLSDSPNRDLEVIPSGSLSLDAALGIGGFPRGRIIEIYGPESSGKSTLCMHAVANCQRTGGTCLYIDLEHAVDVPYSQALGVDTDALLLTQPSTGEQALEIMDRLVRTGDIALVVVDSVAALATRAELEGDIGDRHVGGTARLMAQAMRVLTGVLDETRTCSIWVNQLRERIGVVGYGPTETTTGGRALRFHASIRMDVRRIATEKQGDDAVGNTTRVKVVKNKCAVPHRIAEFTIRYGEGISRELELIDLGIKHGIINKSGSWLSLPQAEGEPMRLGQGKENARQTLVQAPELASEIERRIKDTWGTLF